MPQAKKVSRIGEPVSWITPLGEQHIVFVGSGVLQLFQPFFAVESVWVGTISLTW